MKETLSRCSAAADARTQRQKQERRQAAWVVTRCANVYCYTFNVCISGCARCSAALIATHIRAKWSPLVLGLLELQTNHREVCTITEKAPFYILEFVLNLLRPMVSRHKIGNWDADTKFRGKRRLLKLHIPYYLSVGNIISCLLTMFIY